MKLFRFLVLACTFVFAGLATAQYPQAFSTFKNLNRSAMESPSAITALPDGGFFTYGSNANSSIVAKLDSTGAKKWSRTTPGWPLLYAGNASGFVQVTTPTLFSSSLSDLLYIQKFDASGNLLWTQTLPADISYDGFDPQLAMDAAGSVVIAQTTGNPSLNEDVQVIRFDALTGAKAFDVKYGGANTVENLATLSCDPGGAIYMSYFSGSQNLVRFGPNGAVLWAKPFTGSPTLFDGQGNFYTTTAPNKVPTLTKYDSGGNVLWSVTNNMPPYPIRGAAVGPNGDILVQSGSPVTLVKFSSAGIYQWTSQGVYQAQSISFDSINNIYLFGNGAGYTHAVSKFSSAGVFAWSKSEPFDSFHVGNGIFGSVNDAGTSMLLYPTYGGTQTWIDFHASIYNTSGNLVTANDYDFQKPTDYCLHSEMDTAGYIYVGVDSCPYGTRGDLDTYGIEKINGSTGSVPWSRNLPYLGDYVSLVGPVVYPGNGALIAQDQNGGFYLYHYDNNGNVAWTYHDSGASHQLEDIKVSADGGIYLSMRVVNLPIEDEVLAVSKLDPAGNLLWTTSRPGLINDFYPLRMAVDTAHGGVYVICTALDYDTYLSTPALARFESNGTLSWSHSVDHSGSNDLALNVVSDTAGNAYLMTAEENTGVQNALHMIDPSGNELWNDTQSFYGLRGALAIDILNNVFMIGEGNSNDVIAKYNSSGLVWSKFIPANFYVPALSVVPDNTGGVFGSFPATVNPNTDLDYGIVRIAPNGELAWPTSGGQFQNGVIVHDESGLANSPGQLFVDAAGNLLLTGTAFGPSGIQGVNLLKFNARNSLYATESVPTAMTAGQTYAVSTSFQNIGFENWTSPNYKLNILSGSTWGVSSTQLSNGEVVAPGAIRKFSFNIYAPTTPGTYTFQSKMYLNATSFGSLSPLVSVNVSLAADASRYVSQTEPASVKAGSTFTVKVDMRNVGSNNWTQGGGYVLAPASGYPTWNVTTVPLGVADSIGKGSDKVFTFSATAPPTPGTYNIRFQMKKGSTFFGDRTTVKSIVVTP